MCGEGSIPLYNDVLKYGVEQFELEILDQCFDPVIAKQFEEYNILYYQELGLCYNIRNNGYQFTEKSIEKLAIASTGVVKSDETRQLLSKTGKCRIFTETHRANLSKAFKGKPGRVWTIESRQKLSASLKQRKLTEDHKRKIGDAQKGVPKSKEARHNMVIAQRKRIFN